MKKKTIILTATAGTLVMFAIIVGIIFFNRKDQEPGIRERARVEQAQTEPEYSSIDNALESEPEYSSPDTVLGKEPGLFQQLALHGSYTPLVSGSAGSHIYYTDNVFENRKLTKDEEKEIRDFFRRADEKLTEDILVVGWSGKSADDSLMFNAYQYIDGVVVPDMFYRLTQDGGVSIEFISDNPAIRSLDTAGMIEAEELFPVVDELAWQHRSELYMDRDKKIYVIYHLEYDTIKDELYYCFRINEYSEIRIDAKNGNIIDEYYFNGEYID